MNYFANLVGLDTVSVGDSQSSGSFFEMKYNFIGYLSWLQDLLLLLLETGFVAFWDNNSVHFFFRAVEKPPCRIHTESSEALSNINETELPSRIR